MRFGRILLVLFVTMTLFPNSAVAAGGISGDLMTGLYSGEFDSEADLVGVGKASGQKVTFGGTFHDIYENDPGIPGWSNTREILESVWQGEATPFANVGVQASAASIASGKYDSDIAIWVSHVKRFLDLGDRRSLIVAPLQEHNGDWAPYGCDPSNFKTAYHKFVKAFRDAGIDETQVRFSWAPNGWTSRGCGSLKDYYPGDDVVDIIAISAFNFGTCFKGSSYETPAQAFDPYLNEIRDTIPNAASKPFMIAQTASPRPSCGGDQSAWTTAMMEHLASDPNVVGVVWFNFNLSWETDWRMWTGSSLISGWKQGIDAGNTVHRWPLTEWFTAGELTVGSSRAPEVPPCASGLCDSVVWVDAGGLWGLWDGLYRSSGVTSFYFGNPGDVPFMGDWNGDGVATPGLYRQSDGFVYLRYSNTQGNADLEFFFGNPGDVPLVGDFDGDGRDSVSIWRPSQARVFVINELGEDGKGLGAADFDFYFGRSGDIPFVGDFDGDGRDTIGLYRESTGVVYFSNALSSGSIDLSFSFGNSGDQVLVGDWDGDGDDTVAVYRPATGWLYINLNNSRGAADWEGYVGSHPRAVTAGNR